MFKILVLQALYSLSDEATEFQIKDRLSFQRFLGFGLEGAVPHATTVWLFRERLVKAKAIDRLFARFDTRSRTGAIWPWPAAYKRGWRTRAETAQHTKGNEHTQGRRDTRCEDGGRRKT